MARYKIGDKVRVREDLQDGQEYGIQMFLDIMERFKGKVCTISDVSSKGYYLSEDNLKWYWTDEMLEPVEEVETYEMYIDRISPNKSKQLEQETADTKASQTLNQILVKDYAKKILEETKPLEITYFNNMKETSGTSEDMVNHPSHYTQGKVECIDAIESATVNKKGIEAVCTGNIIKYLWRYEDKNGIQDVEKAQWYLNKLIEVLEDIDD